MVHQPGPLIASGRDADIFEYGPGLVLRRARGGRSLADEAKVMEHARSHGYPAPAIDEISDDGCDLVMERVDGPLLFEVISSSPWTLGRNGRLLGSLLERLHEIQAPSWVRAGPGDEGDRLLHLDLHPLNVIVSPSGPVVIDWANAASGVGATDVAVTWALLAGAGIPTGRIKAWALGYGRRKLIDAVLSPFDRAEIRGQLEAAVTWKTADPNFSPAEKQALHSLVAAEVAR